MIVNLCVTFKIDKVTKITKEKFKSYYRVQMTGRYNMIMQATLAMLAAGLTREEYFECIKNYKKYYNEFIEKSKLNY